MISFTRLRATDFGPYAQLDVELAQRGLVLIQGDNRDSAAASSNGTGKSTLLKALTWCLFGETVDGDRHDAVIRIGQPEASVLVEWELMSPSDQGAPTWTLERTKVRSSSVKLALHRGGYVTSGMTVQQTQAEIVRLLGLDFQAWRSSVMYGQGDLVRFADPATTDSERKLTLKRILRLETLDVAQEVARNKVKRGEVEKTRLDRLVGEIEAELRGLGDASSLQDEAERLARKASEALKMAKRAPRIEKMIAKIRSHLANLDEVRRRIRALKVDETFERDQVTKVRWTASAEEREVERLRQRIAELGGDACPTCGTPSDSVAVRKRVAELLSECEVRIANVEDARDAARRRDVEADKIRDTVQELQTTLIDVDEWRGGLGKLEVELAQANFGALQAKQFLAQIDEIQTKRYKLEERAATLRGRADDAKRAQIVVERELSDLTFWVKGFGNAGLPSLMMDSVIPTIEERANHYLEVLADGDIRVRFDTQSQLKSGETREKLSIQWTIEGVEGATPSGGQRRKISIAVDLALMDLVASRNHAAIDFLALDEIFDGLDHEGKQRVMLLLHELRQKRSTILVVSHDPGLTELFDTVITVQKQDGIARLV